MTGTSRAARPVGWAVAGTDIEERIIAHLAFARAVAARTIGQQARRADRDDLLAWGAVGLVQAARRYREDGGASFAGYAARRVRGCVLDALRAADPLSRAERRAHRAALRVREDVPAPYTETSLDAIIERGGEACLAATVRASAREAQRSAAAHTAPWSAVVRELRRMPTLERRVLVLSYGRGLTLREIGARVGLSESGVCRTRARALARVRRGCLGRAA